MKTMSQLKPAGVIVLSISSVLVGLYALVTIVIHSNDFFNDLHGSINAPIILSFKSLTAFAFIYVGFQLWSLEKRARTYGIVLIALVLMARIVGMYSVIHHGKTIYFLFHREIFTVACVVAMGYLLLPSTKSLFQDVNESD